MMIQLSKDVKRTIHAFSITALVLFCSGCATPSEIKAASHAQIELIGTLDDATRSLQEGLSQLHREQETRIRQEGRVLIARQAINMAVQNVNETATADALFQTSNTKVRPWVDLAFAQPDIDLAIKKKEAQLSLTTDTFLRGSLQNDLDDLNLLNAELSNKPKPVKEIEAVILDDIKRVKDTSESELNWFSLFKAQIGLMKTMATTIDNWLSIDVTITQEQADALKKAFMDNQSTVGGGK